MRTQAVKLFATAVLSTAAFAFASTSTDVEACCGLWNCLFGCCGGCGPRACYRPSYPCAPSGCSYGPSSCSACAPSCAPCATTCSPCGTVACAPCATGDCSVGSSSTGSPTAPAPEANDNWQRKRTYAPGASGSSGTDLGDPGRPAGSSSRKSDTDAARLQGQDADGGFEKPDRTAGETDDGNEVSPAANKVKQNRKEPRLDRATDDQGSARPAKIINLDEKVAWRTAPARTRIDIHPRATNARLVRLPAYPKSDWMPVEDESKIAKN